MKKKKEKVENKKIKSQIQVILNWAYIIKTSLRYGPNRVPTWQSYTYLVKSLI